MRSNQEEQQELEIAELEHVVGYNGKFSNTIHYVPNTKSFFVYSIGGLIVLEDSEDQHNQRFLRGHDMGISAICVGRSGKILASGQVGTVFAKTNDAPVILWDLQSLKPINIFKGLTGCVTQISLSPDERFLAATGTNNYLYVWALEDFTLVVSKVSETPFTQIVWGPMKKVGKHPSYTMIISNAHNIFVNYLEFDIGSMQYNIKGNPVQLPSTGLVRNYTCSAIDPAGEYFYAGTTGGEICIFSIANLIFKAALPVSNNGVYSLAVQDEVIFFGGGDGRIRKLTGKATKYNLDKEVILEGRIVSLSISNDGKEILGGSSSGKIFKSLTADLSSTVHAEGHIECISEVSFKRDTLDLFATIDTAGVILVWDINNLNVVTRCIPNITQKPKGRCVSVADDGTIVSGWEDGFIRCFEVSQKKFSPSCWEIVNAHRGPVTTVYADENYILSGGDDGIVRVWARKTRKLITQITTHKKTITKVFPDVQKSNIIHSCSADKIIHSFDLKTEKKIILHQAKNGTVLSMAQRKDHELELITVGHNNPISYWDCDVVDAVDALEYPYKILTIDISPSGKYMAIGSETAEILIFEVATKEFKGKYDGHSGPVTSIKFTPDEKQIVSVSSDSSLCIWNFFG